MGTVTPEFDIDFFESPCSAPSKYTIKVSASRGFYCISQSKHARDDLWWTLKEGFSDAWTGAANTLQPCRSFSCLFAMMIMVWKAWTDIRDDAVLKPNNLQPSYDNSAKPMPSIESWKWVYWWTEQCQNYDVYQIKFIRGWQPCQARLMLYGLFPWHL